MTSVFSWQNSISLCPASFSTPRPNLPVTLGVSGVPGGSEVKASASNPGHPGSFPGLGRSCGEGKWQPTPVLLPGESHGGRSLVGYSPWGCKELDTTERLDFHFSGVS